MSEPITQRCGLPLLQPAQAQKHVTINEALMRLDGLVNLVLQSAATAAPPAAVTDGVCFAVPANGSGAWAGKGGQIAIGTNGGWAFAAAQTGQRAWIADQGCHAVWDGKVWVAGAQTLGLFGGAMIAGMAEGEVEVKAGTITVTDVVIPPNVMVIGATARVVETIPGSATSWQLGHASLSGVSNPQLRFGQGLGLEKGSYGMGLLGTPASFYAAMPLRLTAAGGSFAGGGKVRLSLHWLELRVPAAA